MLVVWFDDNDWKVCAACKYYFNLESQRTSVWCSINVIKIFLFFFRVCFRWCFLFSYYFIIIFFSLFRMFILYIISTLELRMQRIYIIHMPIIQNNVIPWWMKWWCLIMWCDEENENKNLFIWISVNGISGKFSIFCYGKSDAYVHYTRQLDD